MQFNSFEFILVFLPITVIGYFTLNKYRTVIGKVFLSIASLVFYAYSGISNTIILGLSVIFNYVIAQFIRRTGAHKRTLLTLGIFINILSLLYFKYTNFTISLINRAFETGFSSLDILLPLGISFISFQQIMYLVETSRDNQDRISLLDYVAYILYFPKLLLGPLIEPYLLLDQLNNKSKKPLNWANLSYGIKIFSFGLFKKVILADTFAKAVNWGFGNLDSTTSMDLILIALFYTFQIYFDFSGYSDMAIGISEMLNISLPINFNSPYKALSIRDFWSRWHMTLTGFFTKHLYFPLGGSRRGKLRTYFNTMIVFLVSGLWHGANMTFIIWGALNGLLSIYDRIFNEAQDRMNEVVRWLSTFFSINILWLLFRAESVNQWIYILKKTIKFDSTEISMGLIDSFRLPETTFLLDVFRLNKLDVTIRPFNMILFTLAALFLCLVPKNNFETLRKNDWKTLILSTFAFVWAFLALTSESVFIYAGF